MELAQVQCRQIVIHAQCGDSDLQIPITNHLSALSEVGEVDSKELSLADVKWNDRQSSKEALHKRLAAGTALRCIGPFNADQQLGRGYRCNG